MKSEPDTGKPGRRHHDRAFKQELVRQSLEPGASVSAIALRSGINANMLFKWRREEPQSIGGATAAGLLPIVVAQEGGVMTAPTSNGAMSPPSRPAPRAGIIELEFAGAHLRLRGTVDEDSLCSVLRALRQAA